MESDIITLQDLFTYEVDAVGNGQTAVGALKGSGLRPLFLEKFARRNVKLPAGIVPNAAQAAHPAARGASR